MLEALFERYGALVRFEGIELCGFWGAATLAGATEEDLRALKVGYRARSLLHVSDALARGSVHEGALRETTGRAAPSTASLYGVGPASVGYILVDVFHAFDEVAHISPWQQKILLAAASKLRRRRAGAGGHAARPHRAVVAVARARDPLRLGGPLLAPQDRGRSLARAVDPPVAAASY
jgi:3-methyladenine DNA glycosylase/8-oxoguanine DNA glycosylase